MKSKANLRNSLLYNYFCIYMCMYLRILCKKKQRPHLPSGEFPKLLTWTFDYMIRIHSQDLLITFSEFNLCIIIYFVLLFSLTYLHLPAQPLATVLRHGGHVACMVRLSCFNTCTFTCQPHKPRSHPTSLYQYGPTRKM